MTKLLGDRTGVRRRHRTERQSDGNTKTMALAPPNFPERAGGFLHAAVAGVHEQYGIG